MLCYSVTLTLYTLFNLHKLRGWMNMVNKSDKEKTFRGKGKDMGCIHRGTDHPTNKDYILCKDASLVMPTYRSKNYCENHCHYRTTPKTIPQEARQKARGKNGKYKRMYRCEVCGKALGEDYYSDPRCNTHGGYGQIICKKCAGEVSKLPNVEYEAFFLSIKETSS